MNYLHYLFRRYQATLLEKIKREIMARLEIKGINFSRLGVELSSRSSKLTVKFNVGEIC